MEQQLQVLMAGIEAGVICPFQNVEKSTLMLTWLASSVIFATLTTYKTEQNKALTG